MGGMTITTQSAPLQARNSSAQKQTTRPVWSALMAALAVAALSTAGAPALAQIEVDVLTTGPNNAAVQTSAPKAEEPAALKQDSSADEAAQKIVVAPGTQMQSTEGGTFDRSAAVAAEPSLKVESGGVVMTAGESTETLAVNSGAELLKMLGLQRDKKPAGENLEMNESTTNTLFDVEAVKRLKGAEPTVVYRVVVEKDPLPDPMIVPWIRQAKLLQERFDKAVGLLGDNRVDEGRQELLGIMTDFPESDYATQAKALLAKLDDINKADIPQPVIKTEEAATTITVELSPNIQIGAVIVDPQNPTGNRAMIGGRGYKAGDEIRGEPGHRVVGITENMVQIEVEQSGLKKTFDVPVRPSGANN